MAALDRAEKLCAQMLKQAGKALRRAVAASKQECAAVARGSFCSPHELELVFEETAGKWTELMNVAAKGHSLSLTDLVCRIHDVVHSLRVLVVLYCSYYIVTSIAISLKVCLLLFLFLLLVSARPSVRPSVDVIFIYLFVCLCACVQ
jgi:hypothetical protein